MLCIASPVAQSFATLARALRERGHDAQAVTHFVNQLVFCMFADDVGLLPGQMFTRMLEQARRAPALFVDQAGELFRYARLTGLLDAEPPAFNRAQSTRWRGCTRLGLPAALCRHGRRNDVSTCRSSCLRPTHAPAHCTPGHSGRANPGAARSQ